MLRVAKPSKEKDHLTQIKHKENEKEKEKEQNKEKEFEEETGKLKKKKKGKKKETKKSTKNSNYHYNKGKDTSNSRSQSIEAKMDQKDKQSTDSLGHAIRKKNPRHSKRRSKIDGCFLVIFGSSLKLSAIALSIWIIETIVLILLNSGILEWFFALDAVIIFRQGVITTIISLKILYLFYAAKYQISKFEDSWHIRKEFKYLAQVSIIVLGLIITNRIFSEFNYHSSISQLILAALFFITTALFAHIPVMWVQKMNESNTSDVDMKERNVDLKLDVELEQNTNANKIENSALSRLKQKNTTTRKKGKRIRSKHSLRDEMEISPKGSSKQRIDMYKQNDNGGDDDIKSDGKHKSRKPMIRHSPSKSNFTNFLAISDALKQFRNNIGNMIEIPPNSPPIIGENIDNNNFNSNDNNNNNKRWKISKTTSLRKTKSKSKESLKQTVANINHSLTFSEYNDDLTDMDAQIETSKHQIQLYGRNAKYKGAHHGRTTTMSLKQQSMDSGLIEMARNNTGSVSRNVKHAQTRSLNDSVNTVTNEQSFADLDDFDTSHTQNEQDKIVKLVVNDLDQFWDISFDISNNYINIQRDFQLFIDHCVRELTLENVLFWVNCVQLWQFLVEFKFVDTNNPYSMNHVLAYWDTRHHVKDTPLIRNLKRAYYRNTVENSNKEKIRRESLSLALIPTLNFMQNSEQILEDKESKQHKENKENENELNHFDNAGSMNDSFGDLGLFGEELDYSIFKQYFKELYRKFIRREHAPFEINISDDLRRLFSSTYDAFSHKKPKQKRHDSPRKRFMQSLSQKHQQWQNQMSNVKRGIDPRDVLRGANYNLNKHDYDVYNKRREPALQSQSTSNQQNSNYDSNINIGPSLDDNYTPNINGNLSLNVDTDTNIKANANANTKSKSKTKSKSRFKSKMRGIGFGISKFVITKDFFEKNILRLIISAADDVHQLMYPSFFRFYRKYNS